MQNDKNTKKNKQTKQNKTESIVFFTIIALVIAVLIIMLFRGCEQKNDADIPQNTVTNVHPGIQYDDGAVEGGWTEADTGKIVDSLNQKVEEGMINISMNTTPVFENGTSSGNLMIVNETINRYPQVVEITCNDSGNLIYKSGAIPVGSKIEEAKLDVSLPAGEYECTAMFYNVDPDTGAYLGCAGAIVNITILK